MDLKEAIEKIDKDTEREFSRGNKTLRGTRYEELAKYFLLHSPQWEREIEEAWMWKDKGNPKNPNHDHDYGIDLIARDKDGSYWSCQVKERTVSASYIDWGQESNFLAASEGLGIPKDHRILFLFNCDLNRVADDKKPDGVKVITDSDMAQEEIDWSSFFNPDLKEETKSLHLRPYQREAVERCLEGFKNEDKGQLIMACGTGKTLTGLTIAEKMAEKRGGVSFSPFASFLPFSF